MPKGLIFTKKLAFFDTKPYDRIYFDLLGKNYDITYFEGRLTKHTAKITEGFDAVCAFVNCDVNAECIDRLATAGVGILAMRCAGYSNVDLAAAAGRLTVVRVPSYSPHAIAEHALALLLALNRRIYRAYIRTRDFNFNVSGLMGIDLYGKTAGVIGTGKIGRAFIEICRGLGMSIIACDPSKSDIPGVRYAEYDELFCESDVISLHCPLTESTRHIIDDRAFSLMKKRPFLINTSRGALIDSKALLEALDSGKIRGSALDVYEEEAGVFYEDMSDKILRDNTLALLISRPNVLITSHQAFLTEEALKNIAEVTIKNLDDYFAGASLENEISAR